MQILESHKRLQSEQHLQRDVNLFYLVTKLILTF